MSKNYGKQLGVATHFHPDDVQAVQQAISDIKENLASVCVDVRIVDVNAKYLWTRISSTAYLDENDRLTRIVGFLQDIDTLKRAEQALKERAERDSLTALLNKASAEQLITEYLEQRSADNLSAVLIMDLDNFKSINDNCGHLHGDAVLTQIGKSLKRLFRTDDIIGRIGGDKFMILMRDIPNEDLVYKRCEQILENVRNLLEQNAPNLNTSCSIGVALVPLHGTNYTELFRRADEALYRSKNKSKNAWTVYNPSDEGLAEVLEVTSIDSDVQPGMANAFFVRYVFHRLYESGDTIGTLNDILAYVGEQLNVSRVYIFENNADNTTCSNTFEWYNTGIEPEREYLQNVSYITDVAGWPNVFNEQGVFRAYVGLDERTVHRQWQQEQIELLKFLAEVLVIFLLKKRTQDKSEKQAETLRSILDQQDDWIYVIDPESCEIKFQNAKIKQIAPKSKVGMTCYSSFMGRGSLCENCPAVNIAPGKSNTSEIVNRNLGVNVSSRASQIEWNGETGYLITCRELKSEE